MRIETPLVGSRSRCSCGISEGGAQGVHGRSVARAYPAVPARARLVVGICGLGACAWLAWAWAYQPVSASPGNTNTSGASPPGLVARSIRPMADAEIKAEILFAGNETLRVQSTVEQIKKEIEGVTTQHIILIKVVSQEGDEIWLNANHIRAFKVYDPSMPLVGFG
jgi:hypothetical protein